MVDQVDGGIPVTVYSMMVDSNRNQHDASLQEVTIRNVSVDWISSINGEISTAPLKPYLAGQIDGIDTYIARHKTDNGLGSFVGPLFSRQGLVNVLPDVGIQGQALHNYEFLAVPSHSVCWKPLKYIDSIAILPDPKLIGVDRHKTIGGNIYIGMMENVGIGSVVVSADGFTWNFYTHKNQEPFTTGFTVLCFK